MRGCPRAKSSPSDPSGRWSTRHRVPGGAARYLPFGLHAHSVDRGHSLRDEVVSFRNHHKGTGPRRDPATYARKRVDGLVYTR